MNNELKAVEFLRQIVDQTNEDGFERTISEARLWLAQVVDAPDGPSAYPDIPSARVPRPAMRKNRYGYYCIPVPTLGGRCRWVSTGERSLLSAKRVVIEAGADRLVLLAKAGAMTADSIVAATTGRRLVCETLLKMWEDHLSVNMANGTISVYLSRARQLFNYAGAMKKPLVWITREQLSNFVNAPELKLEGRRGRLKCIGALYKFAQTRGLIIGNLAATIHVRHQDLTWEKKEKKRALPFTFQEYQKFLASNPPEFWRRAVIISYWTGLRLSDVCTLEPAAICDEGLICWTMKKLHRLVLPFSNPLIGSHELVACLKEIKANPWTPQRCFHQSGVYLDRNWGPQALGGEFVRLLKKIGIQNRSFHSLRHAAITRFAASGMNTESIGGLVGHQNPMTTMGYIHKSVMKTMQEMQSEKEVSA